MKPSKSNNTVAAILQGYAIVNALAGLILAFAIEDFGILVFLLTLLASFLLYAFGEVIRLLHVIMLNTSKPDENEGFDPVSMPIQDESVIYFCKSCADAYSGAPNAVRYCPECKRALQETAVPRGTWRGMSDSEKEDLKKRWSAE